MGVSDFFLPPAFWVFLVFCLFLLLGVLIPGFEVGVTSLAWVIGYMALSFSLSYWLVFIIFAYRLKAE